MHDKSDFGRLRRCKIEYLNMRNNCHKYSNIIVELTKTIIIFNKNFIFLDVFKICTNRFDDQMRKLRSL